MGPRSDSYFVQCLDDITFLPGHFIVMTGKFCKLGTHCIFIRVPFKKTPFYDDYKFHNVILSLLRCLKSMSVEFPFKGGFERNGQQFPVLDIEHCTQSPNDMNKHII